MSASPRMADLFASARNDAPSDAVRDAVWGRVAAATSVPAGVAVVAKAVAVPASGNVLSVVAVLGAVGAAVTVGAMTMAFTGAPPAAPANARRAPAVVASGHAVGAHLAEPAPRPRDRAPRTAPIAEAVVAIASPTVPTRSGESIAVVASPPDEASSLAAEARLVTEARSALLRGDAARALALARTTRRLPVRALEPEELALEARALRALNRTDEALAAELTLRRRFPSHALSR